jgi:putative GTP pyrophosphokinase
MVEPELMRSFLEAYKDYVETVLEPTKQEVKEIFLKWKEPSHWSKYTERTRMPAPSPIQRFRARVKRPESVVDKIFRKPDSFPNSFTTESFRVMNDALGVRVILYFLSQLPLIDKELRTSGYFDIVEEIAYLSTDLTKRLGLTHLNQREKDSGYVSIHYILRLKESTLPTEKRPIFELQVRTLAEDIWGEIEHVLGYKPNKRTSFAVKKQFQIISTLLTAIDENFNFLYEELSRFQEESSVEDSDPLNAENLPPVLNEITIGCAQKEIDGLLKLLVSRGIETVGRLRSVATNRRLEIIRNIYRGEEGRTPSNFEVVANLANLVGSNSEEEAMERVKAQISFLRVWQEMKDSGLT